MRITRRKFILKAGAGASAAVAFSIVPRHVLGGPGFVAPSEKVNIAIVGAGGQGRTNVRGLFKEAPDAQVIALADPMESVSLDRFYFKGMAGREPVRAEIEEHYSKVTPNFRCSAYEDFRVMLEKEKAIDAVLCATPDHLHAYVTVVSLRAGKHTFCEKPLTHNIAEARLVAKVTAETKLATQMGNIGHSTEGIRQTVEWLRDGAIGTVREAHSWVPASRWNPELQGKPTDAPPAPARLNWDLWLGPRMQQPYHKEYVPVTWRDFWQFGCGALGDFGCHDMDAATWAFELPAPESVEVLPAGHSDSEIAPYGEIGYYHFPARGGFSPSPLGGAGTPRTRGLGAGKNDLPRQEKTDKNVRATQEQPALKLTWYSGGLRPPHPEAMPESSRLADRGIMFVGERGVIQCDGAGGAPRLYPDSLRNSYTRPAKTLARSNGHHRDWVDAIKGGPPASANFEYGAKLTEITLLGVMSLRLGGKRIVWDAQNMKAKNLAAADEIIHETRRNGWELA
jgi:predicted dehydrogenase